MCRLLRAEVGVLSVRTAEGKRVVGVHGVEAARIPTEYSFDEYLVDEDGYGFTNLGSSEPRMLGHQAFRDFPDLQSIFVSELPRCVNVPRAYFTVCSIHALPAPSVRQVLRARELTELAADVIAASDVLLKRLDGTGLAASMIEQAPFAGALLTQEGRFLFVNEAKAAQNGVPVADHIGALVKDVAPQDEALVRELIARVTRAGEPVLDERVDIGDPEDPTTFQSFSVSAFPVYNDGSIVAISTFMTDSTERRLREMDKPAASRGFGEEKFDPAAEFLVSTLVRRGVMRTRGDMSYVTCRAWRKSIKDSQIAALRALKRDPPVNLVMTAAEEILNTVRKTMGTGSFASVVPVPCGSSNTTDCFAARIGRAVASSLGTPCIEPFEPRLRGGSSHPRRNASLPPLTLREKVSGPCLVVDDVVTSGRHIEQVSKALHSTASDQFRVGWIGP